MAEIALSAPAAHSQPSRKGKKAWRKNVNLTDLQQGIEDAREETIRTGGVIAEKSADELFATDIAGDEGIAKQRQGQRLLKADEIIALRSSVPGLEGHKRKATDTTIAPSKKQKNGMYVSHKELRRLRAVADGADASLSTREEAPTHDLWAEPAATNPTILNFLEDEKPKKEPTTLKHPPKPMTANGKLLPNVRKPDAGKSYNPLVGDWSALLEREGTAAVAAERERLEKEAEAEAKEARALEEAAKVDAAEKEQYATDYDSAWESEWDGFQSEVEVHTQKQKGRKTPTERNKVKTKKEREARELHERKQKARESQEKKIAQLAKEVSVKDKARRAHAMALQTDNIHSSDSEDDGTEIQLVRRRLRQVPVLEAPLEVVLPDELEDSLRRLKPEGNLMQERYRNLLVNGKLKPGRRQWQHKQAKTTRSEKWSYKDWKLK